MLSIFRAYLVHVGVSGLAVIFTAQCVDVPHDGELRLVYSCLTPSAPRIGSRFTPTLTRIKCLLRTEILMRCLMCYCLLHVDIKIAGNKGNQTGSRSRLLDQNSKKREREFFRRLCQNALWFISDSLRKAQSGHAPANGQALSPSPHTHTPPDIIQHFVILRHEQYSHLTLQNLHSHRAAMGCL